MRYRIVNRFGLVLGVAGALAAACVPQITASGGSYSFKMRFTPGAEYKYSLTSTTQMAGPGGQPQNMALKMPFTMKVLGVKDGIATIEYTIGPGTMNGQPAGDQQKTTVKMDSSGRAVEGAPGMGSIGLPKGPIKVGQSWKADMTSAMGPARGMKVEATYKLLGVRTIGGKTYAVVQSTANVGSQGSGLSTSGTGTILLSMTDCSLHSADMKMNMTMAGSGGNSMSAASTIKITREK